MKFSRILLGLTLAFPAFATEYTLAPADAETSSIPTIVVRGDSATDTTDEQLVACQKKFAQTLARVKAAGYTLVKKDECSNSMGGIFGRVSFLR